MTSDLAQIRSSAHCSGFRGEAQAKPTALRSLLRFCKSISYWATTGVHSNPKYRRRKIPSQRNIYSSHVTNARHDPLPFSPPPLLHRAETLGNLCGCSPSHSWHRLSLKDQSRSQSHARQCRTGRCAAVGLHERSQACAFSVSAVKSPATHWLTDCMSRLR